jgi:hypothetical protein
VNRLAVQNYLATHSLADLAAEFAIAFRRHPAFPPLVMLKYNQINSPMHEPIVQQCRGIILDESNDWAVVSYPFDKFFNYGEPNAALVDWTTARVFEKLDGSMMTLYWHAGAWNVASSGLPDASGLAHDSGLTFAELFWKTWKSLQYVLPADTASCFMFELMTPFNRVIVPHTESRLMYIGQRSVVGSMAESWDEDHAESLGWEVVKSHPLASLNDCVEAAAKLRGIDGEGFVVRDAGFRRIKVKCPQYVALSHLKDTLSPRSMLDIIRKADSDEFLTYFPELRPVYEQVKAKFDGLCDALDAEYAAVKHIESQKDFALAIKSSRCSPALFSLRGKKVASVREYFAGATQQAVERAVGIETTENRTGAVGGAVASATPREESYLGTWPGITPAQAGA